MQVKRWSCSSIATAADGSRTYTYTANSSKWDANSTLYLCIPVEQTGAAKKTLTLYPIMGKKATTVTVTECETLPDLSSELLKYDEEYFSLADVDSWYTAEPKKLADGTYQYDESKKLADNYVITDNMSLYAKPKVKDDVKLTAMASLPMHDALSDSNLSNLGRLVNWVYTPGKKAEALDYTDTAAQQAQLWKLSIGLAWTQTDIPGTGTYQQLCTNAQSVSIPKQGAVLSAWWYKDYDNVWHEVKAGEQISSDYVLKMLYHGTAVLTLYPDVTFTNTITLDTGAANLKLGPFTVTSDDTKQVSHAVVLKTEESTAVETAIQAKENTDGFKKLFRGWYLSKDFSGTVIDLKTQYFCSDATLYARWEDAYTLKYDFDNYHPTNQNAEELYKDQPIAKGDKLTEPTRPEAGSVAFVGWYKDEARIEAWNFAEETVSNDATLYAKFEDATQIPVTFKFARANNLNTPETAANYPNTPIAANYPFGPLPVLPVQSRKEYDPAAVEYKTIYFDDVGGKRTLTYTGWKFTDKDGKDQVMTKDTVLADHLAADATSLDVYATYIMSFQFIFDLDGGTTTKPDEVKTVTINDYTGTIAKPTVEPTKEGWDFGGWVDASGNPFDFDKSYNENTTIKDNWVAEKEYTVKFKLTPADAVITVKKQGSDTEIKPSTSENGNVTFKLTKDTYVWSVSADGYKTIQETLTVAKDYNEENVIEVALSSFQPVTGITLNIPDHQIMQKKSYDPSSLATVAPENASNKTIAWTVNGNDGVTLSEDGKTLTVSDTAAGTVTLTATITNGKLNADGTKEENYTQAFTLTVAAFRPTITFAPGTGPVASDIQNMPEPVLATDGKISEPSPAPTASGWTFAGWFEDTSCTIEWAADHTFTADTTLYAKWTKNPVAVTITFAGGEGTTLNTGASGAHNGMSGDKITLPACMYTKPSYIFRSWSGTFAEHRIPFRKKP